MCCIYLYIRKYSAPLEKWFHIQSLFFCNVLKSILFFSAASTVLESILQAYQRVVKATVATFLLHLLNLKSPKKVIEINLCGSDNTVDFIFQAKTSLFSLTALGGCSCLSVRWAPCWNCILLTCGISSNISIDSHITLYNLQRICGNEPKIFKN
jgi:hypothetical protein